MAPPFAWLAYFAVSISSRTTRWRWNKLEFPAKIAVDDGRPMQSKPKPKWQRALTVQRLEIIRQNLDKTDAEVARMLGVGRTAVHFLRQRYHITKVHGTIQRTQRRIEQMRKLKPGL